MTYVGCAPGIPTFRTKVLYIPQRPSMLPLTPRDFVFAIMSFTTRKRQSRELGSTSGEQLDAWMEHPLEVGSQFGVDPKLWNRNWADLSGGEGQRIMMAIGIALGTAEVLLLDGECPLILFSPPPPLNEPIGSGVVFFLFLTWSGTFLLITLMSFPSISVIRWCPRGSRTHVRSRPRDYAGRGDVYLVDASQAGEHSQGDHMGHPFRTASPASWHSACHSHWWDGPRRSASSGKHGVAGSSETTTACTISILIPTTRTAHSHYPFYNSSVRPRLVHPFVFQTTIISPTVFCIVTRHGRFVFCRHRSFLSKEAALFLAFQMLLDFVVISIEFSKYRRVWMVTRLNAVPVEG